MKVGNNPGKNLGIAGQFQVLGTVDDDVVRNFSVTYIQREQYFVNVVLQPEFALLSLRRYDGHLFKALNQFGDPLAGRRSSRNRFIDLVLFKLDFPPAQGIPDNIGLGFYQIPHLQSREEG